MNGAGTANHAYGRKLADGIRHGHKGRNRAEGFCGIRHVETGNDHSLASSDEVGKEGHDLGREELYLVDAYHFDLGKTR